MKEKTLHELAKEFPNKSYRELEIYKNADRKEEANRIPLTEGQQTLLEQENKELKEDQKGVCIIKATKNDREKGKITKLHDEWRTKNGYSIKATRRIRGRSTTNDPGSQKGN